MKTPLKVLCALVLVRGAVADELLAALAGARAGNKVTLCVGGQAACGAALWGRRWVVARASCVRGRASCPPGPAPCPPGPAPRVLHHASLPRASCGTLHDAELPRVRRCYTHPEYRAGAEGAGGARPWERRRDLALLALDRDVGARYDALVNVTHAEDQFQKLSGWMTQVFLQHYAAPENLRAGDRPMGARELRKFFLLVILPLVMFVVVFIFVIFGTGAPVKVPYTNIDYEPVFDKNTIITP